MRSGEFRSKAKVRQPSSVFKQCPSCESPNVVAFEGDVLCTYCGWDSIGLRAEARFDTRQIADRSFDEASLAHYMTDVYSKDLENPYVSEIINTRSQPTRDDSEKGVA